MSVVQVNLLTTIIPIKIVTSFLNEAIQVDTKVYMEKRLKIARETFKNTQNFEVDEQILKHTIKPFIINTQWYCLMQQN